MLKNVIITGEPKSGKSTLLRKLIADQVNKVGFVTNEILEKRDRVGFEIETYLGHKATLASIETETPYKVAKYFVNLEKLESLIPEVSSFKPDDFLYLDEIGQMQLFSDNFKDLVLKYFTSDNICLASISAVYEDDFTKNLKERDDVILISISPENREEKEYFISQLFKKINKAKRYLSEPARFVVKGSTVELSSERVLRTLILKNDAWSCDCDFFKQYNICSHMIAAKQFMKISS